MTRHELQPTTGEHWPPQDHRAPKVRCVLCNASVAVRNVLRIRGEPYCRRHFTNWDRER